MHVMLFTQEHLIGTKKGELILALDCHLSEGVRGNISLGVDSFY